MADPNTVASLDKVNAGLAAASANLSPANFANSIQTVASTILSNTGAGSSISTDSSVHESMLESLRTPEMIAALGEMPEDFTGERFASLAQRAIANPSDIPAMIEETNGPISPEEIYYQRRRLEAAQRNNDRAAAGGSSVKVINVGSAREQRRAASRHASKSKDGVTINPVVNPNNILKVSTSIVTKQAIIIKAGRRELKLVAINSNDTPMAAGAAMRLDERHADDIVAMDASLFDKGVFAGRGLTIYYNRETRTPRNKDATRILGMAVAGDILICLAKEDITEAMLKDIVSVQ